MRRLHHQFNLNLIFNNIYINSYKYLLIVTDNVTDQLWMKKMIGDDRLAEELQHRRNYKNHVLIRMKVLQTNWQETRWLEAGISLPQDKKRLAGSHDKKICGDDLTHRDPREDLSEKDSRRDLSEKEDVDESSNWYI